MQGPLRSVLAALATGTVLAPAALALDFPGRDPGRAVATEIPSRYVTLSNGALSVTWGVFDGRLVPSALKNNLTGDPGGIVLDPPKEVFELVFQDGTILKASRMKAGPAKVEALAGDPAALVEAERFPGQQVSVALEARDGSLRVEWKAVLRDGSNYVRQEIVIRPLKGDADIERVVMVDHWLRGADICGRVSGSPVVAGNLFTGFEHPMAAARVEAGGLPKAVPVPLDPDLEADQDLVRRASDPVERRWGAAHATVWLDLSLPVRQGRTFSASSVLGFVPQGQLRRGFLYYLERERAHGYRPFLHYNSWYDIGYFTPYDERDCLGAIRGIGEELVRKRGVRMDSFLFDDGWDDTSRGGQWVFHKGFPRGFTPVKEAAAQFGAAPGVWLSPWGGYGRPRIARTASAKAGGFELVQDPQERDPEYARLFALSGPVYYESFHRACLDMVSRYGINQFKLDGTGSMDAVMPGSRFGSDFEAAISLIRDLRDARPDLFVNLTTGTWPSPFWLGICDSIWRGGEDHSFEGDGPARERWITYRDADTYQRVVQGGPLYPLNSLMLHGIIYAKSAHDLSMDPSDRFEHEVRSYFGTGTQLQEMYISHGLLSQRNWDVLAASATWSRANAGTLVDTHWVGGDPRRKEVYGWASWSRAKGILTLRNPSEEPRTFTVDLARFFELPAFAPSTYALSSPFKDALPKGLGGAQNAYRPLEITLEPFEVLVLEASPAS
jgi:hypothetical protein